MKKRPFTLVLSLLFTVSAYAKNKNLWMWICLSVMLLPSLPSQAKIDPNTCVAMWLFNKKEDAIAADNSGNGNDGEFVGKPKWSKGKFGPALELDGKSYVKVPDSEHLDTRLQDGFTITVWVNGEYEDTWHGIVTKAQDWKNDMSYLVQRDRGGAFNCGVFPDQQKQVWLQSGVKPKDGTWYHIAVTYDGKEVVYFVDGVLAKSVAYTLGIDDTASPLTIGSNYPNAGQSFQGSIDEVALFNMALDPKDIQTIMEVGLEEATGLLAVDVAGKLTATWAAIKQISPWI